MVFIREAASKTSFPKAFINIQMSQAVKGLVWLSHLWPLADIKFEFEAVTFPISVAFECETAPSAKWHFELTPPADQKAKRLDDWRHLEAARVSIHIHISLVFAQPSLIFVYLAPIWLLHYWQIYDQGVAAKQRRMANCGVAKSNGKCIIKRRVCQMISPFK